MRGRERGREREREKERDREREKERERERERKRKRKRKRERERKRKRENAIHKNSSIQQKDLFCNFFQYLFEKSSWENINKVIGQLKRWQWAKYV